MSIKRYSPELIRRRYSLRIAVALAGVVVVTVAIGGLFFAHVGADMGPAAEDAFVEASEDRAAAADLWLTANADLASGLADSEAVTSGDQDRIDERFATAVEAREDRLVEVHYVDADGEIRASSAEGAIGEDFFDATGQVEFADGSTRIGAHGAVTQDRRVITFVAPAGDERFVAVSAATDSLVGHLGTDGRTVLVDGDEPLVATGEAAAGEDQLLDAASDEFAVVQPEGVEDEYATTVATVDGGLRVISYAPADDVYAAQNTAVAALTALLLVFATHLGLAGIFLGGNVSLSLRQLADRAARLGAGEFDTELETDRVDEIGALYEAFADMRDSLQETLTELADERERARVAQQETERHNDQLVAEAERFRDTMAACAAGDLTRRLEPETDIGAMHEIADAYNGMLDDLEGTVAEASAFAERVATTSTELETSAGEIRNVSEVVSDSVQEISEGASSQSEDLEVTTTEINDLSATVEEVASTTSNIAEQSSRVAALTDSGQEAAASATAEIEDAVDRASSVGTTIRALDEETERIEEIVALIDDIAQQTNILALNAAIEAAQLEQSSGGGESGFNVVAEEVKNLAEETQEAVREVENALHSIQQRAGRSVEEVERTEARIESASAAVEQMRAQFDEVAAGIREVDGGVVEIDDATADQAASTQDLATILEDVAAVAGETAEQAESVAASAEEATAAVGEVSTEVERLDDRAHSLAGMLAVFTVSGETVTPDGATTLPSGGEDE